MIARSVSEARNLGGYHTEDRALLRRCDRSARTGLCVVCEQALGVALELYGLHDECGWSIPHHDEMTIRSAVAMRRFELA